MPPRISTQRISSFISFYSCSHSQPGTSTRSFVTCLNADKCRTSSRPSPISSIGKQRYFHASASNAAPKDPYKVLGVKQDASAADIKKVYFSLARKYHPDTNQDKSAKEKFVEIQEAYDILKDDKKRAEYDQYGAASQQPGFDSNAFSGGFGGAGSFGGFNFGSTFGGGSQSQGNVFEQLFGSFGGARNGRGHGFADVSRGSDLEASIGVSFMEACKGTSRTINITPVVNCGTCSGTGLKAGAKRSTCTSCGGSGSRTFVIDSGFQMSTTCNTCQGTGSSVPRGSQCGECAGVGQVRIRKSVKVDIPAGVEDGMTIRIPNAGDAPVTGKGSTGDLLVRVGVSSSKLFRRQGSNLHHEARIPLHSALLGGRVRVPTLDGEVDVRIPSGTQQGEEMVLKSRGVQHVYGGDKGDLYVKFVVQLPRSLTKRQREILQQYADDVEGRSSSPSQDSKASSDASASEEKPSKANENADSETSTKQEEEDADRRKKAATG